jgi:hypothetical protein
VRAARDQIHLVKVIGSNAHAQQPVNERLHHVGVIVHPRQKNALISQWDAGE